MVYRVGNAMKSEIGRGRKDKGAPSKKIRMVMVMVEGRVLSENPSKQWSCNQNQNQEFKRRDRGRVEEVSLRLQSKFAVFVFCCTRVRFLKLP